jgi:hypothetical protein
MLATLAAADAAHRSGFSVVNLAILALVLILVVPVVSRLRDQASRRRRARWAEEEGNTLPPQERQPGSDDR